MVDNEICLFQRGKFHSLTARKGKWTQKKCMDILIIIQQDSYKYITSEGRKGLSTQKF